MNIFLGISSVGTWRCTLGLKLPQIWVFRACAHWLSHKRSLLHRGVMVDFWRVKVLRCDLLSSFLKVRVDVFHQKVKESARDMLIKPRLELHHYLIVYISLVDRIVFVGLYLPLRKKTVEDAAAGTYCRHSPRQLAGIVKVDRPSGRLPSNFGQICKGDYLEPYSGLCCKASFTPGLICGLP